MSTRPKQLKKQRTSKPTSAAGSVLSAPTPTTSMKTAPATVGQLEGQFPEWALSLPRLKVQGHRVMFATDRLDLNDVAALLKGLMLDGPTAIFSDLVQEADDDHAILDCEVTVTHGTDVNTRKIRVADLTAEHTSWAA